MNNNVDSGAKYANENQGKTPLTTKPNSDYSYLSEINTCS